MKLTSSIVAIAALSTMSFAGGDIIEPVFEQESVEVPVEPVVAEPVVQQPVVQQPVVQQPVVQQPVVAEPVVAEPLGLYIAGGLTDIAVNTADTAKLFSDTNGQERQVGLTGRVGYDFMDYLGAELRGTYGVAKDNGTKFKQVGAYLKPNYDVTDAINLYGLLGASKTNFAGAQAAKSGFSYGAGLDYGITDNISVFTDVVNYLKKSNTPSTWGLTLGAAYQF